MNRKSAELSRLPASANGCPLRFLQRAVHIANFFQCTNSKVPKKANKGNFSDSLDAMELWMVYFWTNFKVVLTKQTLKAVSMLCEVPYLKRDDDLTSYHVLFCCALIGQTWRCIRFQLQSKPVQLSTLCCRFAFGLAWRNCSMTFFRFVPHRLYSLSFSFPLAHSHTLFLSSLALTFTLRSLTNTFSSILELVVSCKYVQPRTSSSRSLSLSLSLSLLHSPRRTCARTLALAHSCLLHPINLQQLKCSCIWSLPLSLFLLLLTVFFLEVPSNSDMDRTDFWKAWAQLKKQELVLETEPSCWT